MPTHMNQSRLCAHLHHGASRPLPLSCALIPALHVTMHRFPSLQVTLANGKSLLRPMSHLMAWVETGKGSPKGKSPDWLWSLELTGRC